jgi:hypothetical protein
MEQKYSAKVWRIKPRSANTDGMFKKLVTVFAVPHLDKSVMREILNAIDNFIKGTLTQTPRRALRANTAPYSPGAVTVSQPTMTMTCPARASGNAY